MSAVEALRAARAAGVEVRVDGGDLVLEAPAPPSAVVLDLLSLHRPAIVALLRGQQRDWSAKEWQAFFDERAGIAEFDGALPRGQAEARAFTCCVAEWLNHNPVCSPPDRCLGCGGSEHTHDKLLSSGTEQSGDAWCHLRCWPTWHASRKVDAAVALTKIGILPPLGIRRQGAGGKNPMPP
jgi:hypothetical protein